MKRAVIHAEYVRSRNNGSLQRSMQIQEWLHTLGLECDPLEEYQRAGVVNEVAALKCRMRSAVPMVWSRHTLKRLGHAYRMLQARLADDSDNIGLFVWEATNSHLMPTLLRGRSAPLVAFPHNIEALGDGPRRTYRGKDDFDRLRREMSLLGMADHVVTISAYDSWFLSQFGINSSYLPYRPPSFMRQELEQVREARLQRPSNSRPRVLLLGSAFYPPIRAGMELALSQLSAVLQRGADVVVDVAGYGSETLRSADADPRLHFHGTVESDVLGQMMIETDIAIACQTKGTGTLTRIQNFRHAGIPCAVNTIAGRNCEHDEGIHVFHSTDELAQILIESTRFEPAALDDAEDPATMESVQQLQTLLA